MQTIYVTDNGLQLKRKSNRILLKKDGKTMEEIPILDLKRILIFGNNQLSTELMRHLAGKGIEVAFLSSHGGFKFRIVPETSKNIYLRMAQHKCFDDRDFRLRFSKAVVEAKLKNQRSLLLRFQRNRRDADLEGSIGALQACARQVPEKTTVAEVMGVEGMGSKSYFQAFGRLLLGGFQFTGREYYPAPDPVNAMLSFGYMLLFNEMCSLLEACGFDVFLGFLHSTRYGRASLASDMVEELRSPVIDRLVLYLINKGVIKPTQFTAAAEKKGIRMDDPARSAFLANYEKFLTAEFQEPKSGKRMNYRDIIKGRVMQLEKALLNKVDYLPYVFLS